MFYITEATVLHCQRVLEHVLLSYMVTEFHGDVWNKLSLLSNRCIWKLNRHRHFIWWYHKLYCFVNFCCKWQLTDDRSILNFYWTLQQIVMNVAAGKKKQYSHFNKMSLTSMKTRNATSGLIFQWKQVCYVPQSKI